MSPRTGSLAAVVRRVRRRFVDVDPQTMTLAELVRAYPRLFRQDQTWHRGEAFMHRVVSDACVVRTPIDACSIRLVWCERLERMGALSTAIELAVAYVHAPTESVWRRYLWTRDHDIHGQRVFLGVNNGRMEIHRHLHFTERWGVPVFAHAAARDVPSLSSAMGTP